MKEDGRAVPNGSEISADLCIVGSGPAALTIASQLLASNLQICVLESGTEKVDAKARDALRLSPTGTTLEPAGETRWRQVGGTANLWNTFVRRRPVFRSVRLSPIDFEQRPGLPNSGWPIGYESVEPYYRRAEELLSVDPPRETKAGFEFDPKVLTQFTNGFGAASFFTHELPSLLQANARVRLITSATVTALSTNESGLATSAQVSSGTTRFSVRARVFILAGGAIENARLLLSSEGRNGSELGNANDNVGRYFLEHHNVIVGRLFPFSPDFFDDPGIRMYDMASEGGIPRLGQFTLNEEVMRERGLLHGGFHPWPEASVANQAAMDAARTVLGALRSRNLSKEAARQLPIALRHLRFLSTDALKLGFLGVPLKKSGGWSSIANKRRVLASIHVIEQCELSADAENRLTLSQEVDGFGMRRAKVEASWRPVDLESVRGSHGIVKEQFESRGIGRFELASQDDEMPVLLYPGGAHHQSGTTRMHSSPRLGVVDENCRLFEAPNVFLAGSSVFPTSGFANSTITVVALSLRLADYVQSTFRPASVAPGPDNDA